MFTCDTTDTGTKNSNDSHQNGVQVCKSGGVQADDRQLCKPNTSNGDEQPRRPGRPKGITCAPQLTADYNECSSSGCSASDERPHRRSIARSTSSSSSSSSSMMVANKRKRRKKCRRECRHHKRHAKAVEDSSSFPEPGSGSQGVEAAVAVANPVSPKVTPIFVWANVNDTKIVRVLCEDYDQRNRIRLTRTATGWRSIPLIASLERRRKIAVSCNTDDDVTSPKLVDNSLPPPDNRLQTDSLSCCQTKNEFSPRQVKPAAAVDTSVDVVDSTSSDSKSHEAVPLSSNSKNDPFSSDEDGQQENLRCMIDKMQTDSLYSDEECEPSVASTVENHSGSLPGYNDEENSCALVSSSGKDADSINFMSEENFGESIASPRQTTSSENVFNHFSDNSEDSDLAVGQSSNIEICDAAREILRSPHHDHLTEDLLNHFSGSFGDSHSNAVSKAPINEETPSGVERIVASSPRATSSENILNRPSNSSENNDSNALCRSLTADDISDCLGEIVASSCRIPSPETLLSDLSDNFVDSIPKNVQQSVINCEVYDGREDVINSPKDIRNHHSDSAEECNSDTVCQSLGNEVSMGLEKIVTPPPSVTSPKNMLDNFSNSFVDSNSNIVCHPVTNDVVSVGDKETDASSCCKSQQDNDLNSQSSDSWVDNCVDLNKHADGCSWIDNNSNIISQSTINGEKSDNVEETVTSPCCIISPKDGLDDYADACEDSNSNVICQLRNNEIHVSGIEKILNSHPSATSSSGNVKADCKNIFVNSISSSTCHDEGELRLHSPLVSAVPFSGNGITSEKKNSNLTFPRNSILSSLLQTDSTIGKLSDENVENTVVLKETNENCELPLKRMSTPEVEESTLVSIPELNSGSLCSDNMGYHNDVMRRNSSGTEFLYRSYLQTVAASDVNENGHLLETINSRSNLDVECMDLSMQRNSGAKDNQKFNEMVVDNDPHNINDVFQTNADKNAKYDKRHLSHETKNSCNVPNVKIEDSMLDDEMELREKYAKFDTTVLKVPLCQTLKSSGKCTNARRLHIRRRSKLSDEHSEHPHTTPTHPLHLIMDDITSTDIKPCNQHNTAAANINRVSPLDLCQIKPAELPKRRPSLSEFAVTDKALQNEKEKLAEPIKIKPNAATAPVKERIKSLDPLEQLKDVLSNPLYSVPDPLLVPKARLSALVTCPGREIPRLLARRAQNLSYVSILSDPDVLVVSLSHLRSLMTKPLNETDIHEYQKHTEEIRSRLRLELLNHEISLENASLFGGGWNEYQQLPPSVAPLPSKSVSGSKIAAEDPFRGFNFACNSLNLCYPADMGRDSNGNCGLPYPFERGSQPWSGDVSTGQKSNTPTYDPCAVAWNDQLCAHLACYQTSPGTCSVGRSDLLYCPCDAHLRNAFPSYVHSALSCPSSLPVLRGDFGAKNNCLSDLCYPWMDFGRCVDDKGPHQSLETPFELPEYPSKTSQPLSKCNADLKVESPVPNERDRVGVKVQSKDGQQGVADVRPDRRDHSAEPKIKVRQHLVDPNRRPLLLNTQPRAPYESPFAAFLRPWSNEGLTHPFVFSEPDKKNKKFQWTTPATSGTS